MPYDREGKYIILSKKNNKDLSLDKELIEYIKRYEKINEYNLTFNRDKKMHKSIINKEDRKNKLLNHLKLNPKGLWANKEMASYLRITQRSLNRYIHELYFSGEIESELKHFIGGGRGYYIQIKNKEETENTLSKKKRPKN